MIKGKQIFTLVTMENLQEMIHIYNGLNRGQAPPPGR